MFAKQSTAATLIIGPILDANGVEYASAVIGDISLSKNGATLTALASAATLTYIANGQYTLVTTTGNMDTVGRAQFTCNKSTYQMPPLNVDVLPAPSYDALVTNGLPTANTITHLNQIYDTDYATVYDATNKAFLSKLGNFAMGGSSLVITYGSSQDFTSTQKTSIAAAVPSATDNATATAAQVTSDHGIGSYVRNTEPLNAAGVRSALGLGSANLDTQLLPLASFTFTVAGQVDVNIQYVNDVQIKGTGTSGDPWNPV